MTCFLGRCSCIFNPLRAVRFIGDSDNAVTIHGLRRLVPLSANVTALNANDPRFPRHVPSPHQARRPRGRGDIAVAK
jgi:hypothetical protein